MAFSKCGMNTGWHHLIYVVLKGALKGPPWDVKVCATLFYFCPELATHVLWKGFEKAILEC
jgi:hypothetical protein